MPFRINCIMRIRASSGGDPLASPSLRCVQTKDALVLRLMSKKKGPRGSRSPCPEWWVAEANRRLHVRGLTKKKLAQMFSAKGIAISETMVIRCLLDDPHERIPTIETITGISRALGMPLPVVVAADIKQAMELDAVVAFSLHDAKMLAFATEASDEGGDEETGADRDADHRRDARAMDSGGPRAQAVRHPPVRRNPRTR